MVRLGCFYGPDALDQARQAREEQNAPKRFDDSQLTPTGDPDIPATKGPFAVAGFAPDDDGRSHEFEYEVGSENVACIMNERDANNCEDQCAVFQPHTPQEAARYVAVLSHPS